MNIRGRAFAISRRAPAKTFGSKPSTSILMKAGAPRSRSSNRTDLQATVPRFATDHGPLSLNESEPEKSDTAASITSTFVIAFASRFCCSRFFAKGWGSKATTWQSGRETAIVMAVRPIWAPTSRQSDPRGRSLIAVAIAVLSADHARNPRQRFSPCMYSE